MQPSNKPSSSCTPLVWIGTRAAARRVCYYYCGSLETENTHITAKELMTVFPYWGKKKKYCNKENSKIHFFPHLDERCHGSFLVFCSCERQNVCCGITDWGVARTARILKLSSSRLEVLLTWGFM